MVRRTRQLVLVLGIVLAAFVPAAVAAAGPVQIPPVIALSRVTMDTADRTWVTGHDYGTGTGVVAYYEVDAWHALPAPPLIHPSGLAVLAEDDVWVMNPQRLAHWDGATWRLTPHPRADNRGFSDIIAIAAGDVWVVGRQKGFLVHLPGDAQGERTQLSKPLAIHWDGTTWRTVPVPVLPGIDQGLDSVSAGGGQLWAVGEIRRLVGSEGTGASAVPIFRSAPLALQWRNGGWRRVYHANAGVSGTSLVDVDVLPSGIPWVAGVVHSTAEYSHNERWSAVVERRKGAHWVVRQKGSILRWTATAVSATSCHDVWLAGMENGDTPSVQHWDGRAWGVYRLDDLGWTPGPGRLQDWPDVWAAPGNVWLLGGWTVLADLSDTTGDPLVWRHDGSGWTKVPFALP